MTPICLSNGFVPVFHRQTAVKANVVAFRTRYVVRIDGVQNKRSLVTKARGLPPANDQFLDPDDPLFDYKNFARELVASTSFAEAVCFHPSRARAFNAALTYALMFQTFANNKFQPTEFISFSNNIISTKFRPIDIGEAEKLISQGQVAIVFVDPIQGNVGEIHSFKEEHLQSLRTACDKGGVLLAFDELQCGLGQTGRLWAHEVFGVKPDLMMVGNGGGYDICAILVNKRMNDHIYKFEEDYIPYGCGKALINFRKYARPDVLAIITRTGVYFKAILIEQLGGKAHVREIRAFGLLVEIELDVEAQTLVDKCEEHGIGNVTSVGGKGNIMQILVPLVTSCVLDLDSLVHIIDECMNVLD